MITNKHDGHRKGSKFTCGHIWTPRLFSSRAPQPEAIMRVTLTWSLATLNVKHGIGFTKSVALEYGSRGIRCNAIAPGFIETEMTEALDPKDLDAWKQGIPMKRGGQADEVADLAVFLGSDMSTYITGQVIEINGGMNT